MQFVAREVEAKNKKISRNAMKSFRRHAQRTLIRSVRINLRNGAKRVCRNGKSLYSCQAQRLLNFEYGDAADTFIEDEWKMLALVARYRPTCSIWLYRSACQWPI